MKVTISSLAKSRLF